MSSPRTAITLCPGTSNFTLNVFSGDRALFEIENGSWSMAVPPQLCELVVKVETEGTNKVRCLLDMTTVKDPNGGELENISLELSPEALSAAIDSLVKVRAQLDSIVKKTKA